ncbi:uncharacterized protein ISCGN_021153 [Ixodes scapularis]
MPKTTRKFTNLLIHLNHFAPTLLASGFDVIESRLTRDLKSLSREQLMNGAVETVTKLVECVLEGIVDLEPGAQVYIILQILEEALQRNGLLSVLLTPIMNICNSVSLDCSLLNLDTTTICGDLFVISLPSALNFGQVLGGQVISGVIARTVGGIFGASCSVS